MEQSISEAWPRMINESGANISHQSVMRMLAIHERYDGSVVCVADEDDACLLSRKLKHEISQIFPDRELFFSIRTTEKDMTAQENGTTKSAAHFRKKLGWLIKEQPDAERMSITPEMARIMMERNHSDEWRNRPESASGIKRFARRMANGEWHYTGETIIFSNTGNLLNGQHRLMACMEANTPFESLVAFGVENEAFKFMDVGLTRTAGHVFAIEGIPNYHFCASACRLIAEYFAERAWSGNTHGGGHDWSNDRLLDVYYQHEDIQRSQSIAVKLSKAGLMTPRWAGLVHYVCAKKSRAQADDFFQKVATGVGIESTKDPVHVLRGRLIKNSQSSADKKEGDMYVAAYAIKAWNAMREGRKISFLKFRVASNPNESFPRAV